MSNKITYVLALFIVACSGAFPGPLKLICGKGNIQTGDWSQKSDVLKCYSGGLWYRKQVKLSKEEIANNIFIDLGEVVASAEVHVNGKKAGICMKKPFRLDIKDFVKEGDNYIEILVYSNLANHYYTIPTPDVYKSSFGAGLVGPVKICYSHAKPLKKQELSCNTFNLELNSY